MKKILLLFTISILIIALCAFLGSCKKECSHVYDNECDDSCNECGESRQTSHKMTEADCESPSVCSVCGITDGVALGHKISGATCTAPGTCSVCGYTDGALSSHTWNDANCLVSKTCSVCGAAEGDAAGHSWIDATCTVAKTCSVCGETDGEPIDHSSASDDGDCTTDISCSICGTILQKGNDSHTDIDSDGICDRDGCEASVGSNIEDEKEPDDLEGGFDFPMDPNL